MDPSTIKFLIGHAQDSTVMETTYQHLTDEDHINAARRKTSSGRDAEEKEGALTPETCPTCKENLPPQAKACPNCGQVFTPDAQGTKQQIEGQMKDSYKQTDPDDTATQEKIDALDDLLDDPEVKAALLEKLQE